MRDRDSRTLALVDAVHGLIGMARDDPRYRDKALNTLELCRVALQAIKLTQDEHRQAIPALVIATQGPGNRGVEIALLAAQGKGVREIARELGVNASTVSRRLRRTVKVS